MKDGCAKRKDQLIEAALTGAAASGLEEHLSKCADCARELAVLRERREQMDELLPRVAREAEPPADFHARVLAAAEAANEAKGGRLGPAWGLAGAMAAIVGVVILGLMLHWRAVGTVPQTELAAAQRLAEWRAPSDVLLQTPGIGIMKTTPKLGESYLHFPVKTNGEE